MLSEGCLVQAEHTRLKVKLEFPLEIIDVS